MRGVTGCSVNGRGERDRPPLLADKKRGTRCCVKKRGLAAFGGGGKLRPGGRVIRKDLRVFNGGCRLRKSAVLERPGQWKRKPKGSARGEKEEIRVWGQTPRAGKGGRGRKKTKTSAGKKKSLTNYQR